MQQAACQQAAVGGLWHHQHAAGALRQGAVEGVQLAITAVVHHVLHQAASKVLQDQPKHALDVSSHLKQGGGKKG
jgi:hypothetical protein